MLADLRTTFQIPWWQSITAFTLGLRVLVLPLNVSLLRNTLRIQTIQPQINELDFKMRQNPGTPESLAAARDLKALFKKHKCHPLKNIITPFFFPPLFLSLFGAVHWLCMQEPSLQSEGLLWFLDLTAPDHSNTLPVLSAITWLLSFELGAGQLYHMNPKLHSYIRLLTVAFIPITLQLPAGVFVFWITSNVFAIVRILLTRWGPIRRLLRIPSGAPDQL